MFSDVNRVKLSRFKQIICCNKVVWVWHQNIRERFWGKNKCGVKTVLSV